MALSKAEEYEVCRARGHAPSGQAETYGTGPTYQRCRWCGTQYYFPVPEPVELLASIPQAEPAER